MAQSRRASVLEEATKFVGGVRRRAAEAIAAAAASTFDTRSIAAQAAEIVKGQLPAGQFDALARDQFDGPGVVFSPGRPITPWSIDPREPGRDRPEPRRSDFPTSVNLQLSETRLLPFSVLRDAAEKIDVIRECVEVRKAQMLGLSWDITLTSQAIKTVMAEDKISSPGEAAQVARAKYESEMVRLRNWWEKPDPLNQMDWPTWLALMLEEQLVVDALSIWPRRRLSGECVAFEIIDGTTIKPLLDHRGSTPIAPDPAYQQVLQGFPRGEFTASGSGDMFLGDQLIYRPRVRRTFTPYGYPDVEKALSAADIYLKRVAWMRAEFDEGTTPATWLTLPVESKLNPTQIRDFEVAINEDLRGKVDARMQLRMLPPGVTPKQQSTFADLYKPELDEFLIKLLCAAFNVMPTEIGFPPGSGIGGKGHQEGEENSSFRKAVRPTAEWVQSICTEISRTYLGMPDVLQFKLIGYEVEDQREAEEVADSIVKRGGNTLNEDRARRGQPLYSFPEADTPFVVTGSGLVFLEGALEAQRAAASQAMGAAGPVADIDSPAPVAPAATEAPPAVDAPPASAVDPSPAPRGDGKPDAPGEDDGVPEEGDPIDADEPVPEGFIRIAGHLRRKAGYVPPVVDEATKFAGFARKRAGQRWRDFTFEHVPADMAHALNVAGAAGDLELIKTMVAGLGKAKARRVSRADKDKLAATHGKAIAGAVLALLPAPAKLAAAWAERAAESKAAADPTEFVQDQIADGSFDDVDDAIAALLRAGHLAAWKAAWIYGDEEEPHESAKGSRLAELIDSVPGLRDALVATAVGVVAGALVSRDQEAALETAFVEIPWGETFAAVNLTASCTAGTLDSATKQNLAYVELVVSPGECEFCTGYEGRIMKVDQTSGMPPLHVGCQCDIEPLP